MATHLYPHTMHFDAGVDAAAVVGALRDHGFVYPVIGKPDNGGRGRGIKLLTTERECIAYVNEAVVEFHIQEFINYPNEVGIFYYKYPGDARGQISGIVRKEFLTVKGDGKSTIHALLLKDERHVLQLTALRNMYGEELDTVLPDGKEKLLVPYGNHARGAKFLDETYLADEQVTDVVNDICNNIEEFYFGRLDIRYNTWEEFRKGQNFSVIEANGAGSEPTHMYDPRHTIFFAWKEIIRHWWILNKISRLNHKKGARYLTVAEGLKMFREDAEHSKKLEQMSG